MDIKQLRYFLEACKSQSFAEAARVCYITPQGISIAISRLEKELGTTLFIRSNGGVTPTEDGYYLIQQASEMLRIAKRCKTHYANEAKNNKNIRLLFIRGTVEMLAMDSIAEFKRRHPTANVIFSVEPDALCVKAIQNEEADLAVCAGPIRNPELSKKLLYSGKNLLVINKNNTMANKNIISIDDLRYLKLSLPIGEVAVTNTVIELCRKKGFEPQYIQNDEPRMAFQCAKLGLQAGIVNEVSAGKLAIPEVRTIPFDTDAMNWNIYLIRNKRDEQTALSKAFEACLLETARKNN